MTTKKLDVKLFDELVGYLSQEEQELCFEYAEDYLKKENAKAISLSLELQKEKHKSKKVDAFFSGFLPEAEIRMLLAKKFGISEENDFSFLNKLGGECAGALSVGSSKKQKERKEITEADLNKYFKQIPEKALMSFQADRRLSLAGAQNKLVVIKENQKIFFPASNEFSTHILKPSIDGFKDSVYNEAFCMNLAKAVGLETAEVEIAQAEQSSYLLIKRYDRKDGQRLHQEDFAQASGILPKFKYEKEGGIGLKESFELVKKHSQQAAKDTLRLLDLVIFNFLIGNNDAHAKNFSFLYQQSLDAPLLAPAYDLLCTSIYPELSSEMAMRIGKEYKYRRVRPSSWQRFAEEINIKEKFLAKRLEENKSKVLETAEELANNFAAKHPSEIYSKIIKEIKERTNYALV